MEPSVEFAINVLLSLALMAREKPLGCWLGCHEYQVDHPDHRGLFIRCRHCAEPLHPRDRL